MAKTRGSKRLTINGLMRIVSGAYPDGYTAEYWNTKTKKMNESASGDTLAEFIVREVTDCCCDCTTAVGMLTEALRVMEMAREELDGVCEALHTELVRAVKSNKTARRPR